MLIRINNNGTIDGVMLTSSQISGWLQNLPNHQIIQFTTDVVPSKIYTYTVPITYIQDGLTHYNYVQVYNLDGTPMVDSRGNLVKNIQTVTESKIITLITDMSQFNINDVVQEKYKDLANQNYFQNFYAEQFYTNPKKGSYQSSQITAASPVVQTAVVHAEGDFNAIQISNDGGNVFIQCANDTAVTFSGPGNGKLVVRFDIAPNEYGILY